jgi:hypothetical protein
MEMQIQYNQQQQKFQQETQVYQRGNDAVLRNLETQIVQIAKQVANNNNQGGSFSANTETNPKEQCKSITTRSGKEIGKGIGDNLRTEESVVEAREEQEERMEESEKDAGEKNNEEELVEKEKYQKNEKNKKMNEEEYKGEVSEERKAEVQKARNEKSIQKSPPIQHLPYPHAQSKKDKER